MLKNLAFALSFVTVCACNTVSKDEFEALKFDIDSKGRNVREMFEDAEKKVNEMFKNAEKEVDKKLDETRNEVVSKKNFSGWFLRELIVSLGNDRVKTFLKVLLGRKSEEKIFTGDVFKVSVDNKKIVIKRNGEVIYENFEVTEIEDLDFIVNVVKFGGKFVLEESFKDDNKIKVKYENKSNFCKISVGKYTTSAFNEVTEILKLLESLNGDYSYRLFLAI